MMAKILPNEITSYDLLKSFAVLIMIVDHIGSYFYPDLLWWRAVGASTPLWIGLMGYANSRHISKSVIIGFLVLLVLDFSLGNRIFPLNIIGTFIILRLTLDKMANFTFNKGPLFFVLTIFLFALLWFPTRTYLFSYGSTALVIALLGYALRRKEDLSYYVDKIFTVAIIFYIFDQSLMFTYTYLQNIMMIVSVLLSFLLLYTNKPKVYPGLKLHPLVKGLIQFCGRRTLEIYVVHLCLFKVAAFYLGTKESAGLFALEWF